MADRSGPLLREVQRERGRRKAPSLCRNDRPDAARGKAAGSPKASRALRRDATRLGRDHPSMDGSPEGKEHHGKTAVGRRANEAGGNTSAQGDERTPLPPRAVPPASSPEMMAAGSCRPTAPRQERILLHASLTGWPAGPERPRNRQRAWAGRYSSPDRRCSLCQPGNGAAPASRSPRRAP